MDGTAATPIATGGVAALISHGPNGLRAWIRQGTQNANPLTCDEAHNSLFSTLPSCTLMASRFFKGERAGNDDVVAYLTADDIIQALAKQGAILSATAQVSDDLAKIRNDKINTKMTAGSCATLVGGATGIDPWGNGYAVLENTTATNFLPICICSNGGTGTLPTAGSCSPTLPTRCLRIDVGDVNPLRVAIGNSTC